MTSSKQYDVFLSYKREDTEIMAKVRDALRADGIIVWTDEAIDVAGEHRTWSASIDKALHGSKSLVLLASKASHGSEYVMGEIETAKGLGLPVFPVVIKDTPNEALPLEYRRAQYIDARETKLQSALSRLIEDVVEHLKLVSISKFQLRIEQLITERNILQKRYNQLRKDALQTDESVQLSVHALEEDLNVVAEYLHKIREELAQAKRQNIMLFSELQQANSQTEHIQQDYEHKITELKQRYDLERDKITVLERKITTFEEQINRLQKIAIKEVDSQPNLTLGESFVPKQLNAANLIDWLRLLWWIFITPQVFKAHQSAYGDDAHERTGAGLANLLIWLPMFLMMLAPTLNTNLIVKPSQFTTITPLGWCGIIVIGWAVMWFINGRDILIVSSVSIVIIVMVIYFIMVPVSSIATGVEIALAVIIAFGIVGGIANCVGFKLSSAIAVAFTIGITFNIANAVAGGVVGSVGVTSMIAFVIAVIVAVIVGFLGGATIAFNISNRVKAKKPTPIALIGLVGIYSFFIWVYFLGGATVLGYVKA